MIRGPIFAVALLAASPERAEACFCAPPITTMPADGMTDVPIDARVLVSNAPVADVSLHRGDELVATADREVWRGSSWNVIELRPTDLLAPDTTFEVRRGSAVLASFQTGLSRDQVPPGVPSLAPALRRADAAGSSCGDAFLFVDLGISDSAGVGSYEVAIEGEGVSEVLELLPSHLDEMRGYSSSTCDILLPIVVGEEYCFTVKAKGLAGNESAPATGCSIVTECADVGGPGSFDGDLGDCAPPSAGGCSSSPGRSAPAALWIVLGCIVARRWRRRRA